MLESTERIKAATGDNDMIPEIVDINDISTKVLSHDKTMQLEKLQDQVKEMMPIVMGLRNQDSKLNKLEEQVQNLSSQQIELSRDQSRQSILDYTATMNEHQPVSQTPYMRLMNK